jgi:hypothetical protein
MPAYLFWMTGVFAWPQVDPCRSTRAATVLVDHDRDGALRSDVSTQCGYWPTIGGEG